MRNKNLVCLGRLKKSEGRKKDGLILGESERTKRAEYVDLVLALGSWQKDTSSKLQDGGNSTSLVLLELLLGSKVYWAPHHGHPFRRSVAE